MEQNIKDALNDRIIQQSGLLYDVKASDIKKLGGFENFIFEFTKNQTAYILRLVHSSHRSFEMVEAEMEFIEYLSENGASVSTVVHSINDKIIEKVEDDFGGFFSVSVFSKASGAHVKKEDISPAFHYTFGKEVAKLHVLTKSFSPKIKRHAWNEEDFLDIGKRSLKEEDMFVIEKTKEIMKRIESYPISKDDYGLIHTDLHFGNMFYDNGTFTFFDFDDAAYKHFISDIAIVIFYQFYPMLPDQEKMEKAIKEFLSHFLKGYLEVHDLDLVWFTRLNDFLKLRECVLYMVLHGAGEDFINGPWGQRFVSTFRDRILHDTPFVDLQNILDIALWNSYKQKN